MNIKNLAFWIMILVVIGLSIYLIVYVKSESSKCMSSPLTYGVSKYKSSEGEFTCTCKTPTSKDYLYVTGDNLTLMSFNNNNIGFK